MKLIKRLLEREFRFFANNNLAIMIFIGAPILYALLIGLVYKDAVVKDLPIIVVDLDNSPLSNRVIDALDDNQYIKVADVRNAATNLKNEMVRNNYTAVVTIPYRFEADIQQKRFTEIDADINGANMLTGNYAATGIQTVLSTLNAGLEIETLKKKGIPTAIASEQFETFRINLTRFFNPSSNYLLFLWPGVLGTILQQVFLLVLALAFSREYEHGTFPRLLKYSKSASLILFAKSIPYFIIGFALWVPLIWGYFHLFHVEIVENIGLFIFVSIIFVISVIGMGFLASVIFKTQLKTTEVLMVIATPSFIISGQTWPLSQMPAIVKAIADIIPLTHFLEAFRRLMLYNASFSDIKYQVYALIILAIVFTSLALIALKIKIKRYLQASA